MNLGYRPVYLLALVLLASCIAGCFSGTSTTAPQLIEGDNSANYEREFREQVPADVTLVNSVVGVRPQDYGVKPPDDFEFELIVPEAWIQSRIASLSLAQRNDDHTIEQITARKANALPWYAPDSLDHYDLYIDTTGAEYIHMLVTKEAQPDGRRHLFISGH